MASKVMELFERMNFEQKLRDRRFRMITAGVAAALLIMISIVIRPAFSAEKVLVCTQAEHTHGQDCYTEQAVPASERLGCRISAHSHNEKCLDEAGNMICTKADYIIHSHNEYCYNGNTLVCTIGEKSGTAHTHADSCYDESGVLTCALLEAPAHNHTAECIDISLPALEQVLTCSVSEHTHADECYTVIKKGEEVPTASSTDSTESSASDSAPAVSGSDSQTNSGSTESSDKTGESADSSNENAAAKPEVEILSSDTDMNVLYSTLLMSAAPSTQSDDGKTPIALGETVTLTVPAYKTDETYIFTPPYSHSYTIKYTYSSGTSPIKIYDSEGNMVNSSYTTNTVTINLDGGETYTFSLYNDYGSQKTATITPNRNDDGHIYINGACGCGVEEPELSGTCGSGVTWAYKNNVLTISGTGSMTSYGSGGAPWYADANVRKNITSVVIEDGVSSIGQYAFYGCTALKEVEIPDSVTSIGSSAFRDCTSLEEIDIPDSVTSIGSYAFRGCSSLEEIDIPDGVKTINQYTFYGCTSLKDVSIPDSVTSIGNYAFQSCSSLESIDIPDGVTSINQYTFYGCTSLKEVSIPDSVTSIGSYAFYNCNSLENIDIPENVTSIGSYAFYNCSSLKDVDIPDGVTSINQAAFYNCDGLTEIEIPDGVTSIGSSAFYDCDGLAEVVIPDSVKTINSSAFSSCDSLKTAKLSENITSIPSSLFSGCTALEEIDIPENVTSIGSSAFSNCDSLTEIEIPESVTTINSQAFYDCDGLTSVKIPDSVTNIYSGVFYNCDNLKTVELSENITSIPSEMFRNCTSLGEIDIPETVTSIGDYAFYNCDGLTETEIPDSVTSIGNYAFYDCDGLNEAEIPESVKTIGNYAFNSCSNLNSVEISDGVESIGTYAFSNCTSLENVVIPDSVTSVGTYAFSSCTSLKTAELSENMTSVPGRMFYNCTSLESVDIPEGITIIDSSAFYECRALKSADIPGNVTTIGSSAFYNCDSLTGDLVIDNDLEKIDSNAYYGCDGIESITINGDVTNIGTYAFRYMRNLESVTINGDVGTLGNYALYECSALKELVINGNVDTIGTNVCYGLGSLERVVMDGDVKSIDANAFYNCDKLTELKLSDTIESIGNSAFYDCDNLLELDLPDSLKTIGTSSFQSMDSLTSLILPSSLESVGSSAFSNCSALTEITLDSKNLSTVAANAFTGCSVLESLTVTDNVDVLSAQFIDSLSNIGDVLDNVTFEGENYLTIEKDIGTDYPLAAGEYYVDAQGVLYLLDKEKGTATLARIPEGITDFTVPETIPSETEGETYSVIGVEPNALKTAEDLTALEFAKPENITYLPAGSCSNCPTLESVNGEVTVSDAYDLFTNKDLVKYDYVFYNTGLEDNGEKTDEEISIVGGNADLIPLIKIITGKNEGTGSEEFKGTYTYYTGETAKLTVAISNANAGNYDSVRVYIAFDDDGGQMSWPLGNHSVKTEKGIAYNLKVAQSDVKNVYYIECDRIAVGDTVSANLTLSFPSPTTGGGKVRIWPVVLNEGEKEKVGDGVVPGEKFNEVEWITDVDDFSLTKQHSYQNSNRTGDCIAAKGSDGRIYLNNLYYKITQSRIGDTLLGMGKDHMKSVDYEDILRLPEGLYWHEDVLEAVRNGSYTVSGTTVYANVDGTSQKICTLSVSGQNAAYIKGSLELEVTEDNDIAVRWSCRNTNVNATEMNNITATLSFNSNIGKNYTISGSTYTDYQTFICVDENYIDQKLTLHNDVDSTQHFCYSEDQTDHAEVEKTMNAGTTDFIVTKNRSVYSYWGDRFEYTVGLKNPYALDYPGIYEMRDPLPDELYIRPEDMQRMFDEAVEGKDRIKSLTITIDNATLCTDTAEAYTPGAPAVGTDGSSHTLVQNNTGVGTQYSGCEITDPAEYDTDATLVLTCTTADGKQTLSYNGSVLDATDIASALEALGYVVTRNAQYTVTWELADDFILESSEYYTRNIYSRVKDSFMLISDDEPNYADNTSITVGTNIVYVKYMKDGNSAQKSASRSSYTVNRDFQLYKDYAINGVANAEVAEVGDIIDYTIKVVHNSSTNPYSVLPLTDHMTGGQVMLVPAEGNDHLAGTYGLSTIDVDGVSYYTINKVGVYKNVLVGDRLADSITVSAMADGGLDTLIRWNLHDITASCTKYIGYKAIVDPAGTGVSALQFALDNETWLNDHQTHRLYDTIGDEGIGITGTQVAFDKYIVTDKGATPNEDALAIYSRFEEGQTTTYRLSLTNLSEEGVVNINGKYIYDSLPKTRHEVYKWAKEEMTMTFVPAREGDFSFTFDGGSLDSAWYIDSNAPAWTGIREEEDQQWIRWSDDFTIHLKGTVYIYVTIKQPEGAEWIDNAIKYRETVLENSFYVYEKKATVTHDLAIQAEAYLQKGVRNTCASLYSASSMTINKYDDARWHYLNSATEGEYVQYYIVLYNSGHTRLYLNPIQDYLPQGFSFYNGYYYISTSPGLNVYDNEGNKLTPVWKNANLSVSYSGRNVTFTLSDNTNSNSLKRDPFYDKCYLAPNEAVFIYYYAKVGERGTTEEIATNYAAMPYFDYLGQGVVKGDVDMELPSNYNSGTNQRPNDGECNLADTAEIGNIGMTGGSVGTQWLESHVSLTPGEIVPGITKWVEKITRTNGQVSVDKETAGSEDTVTWAVKMTNTGTDHLVNYTFTDVMNGEYGFVGDVLFSRKYEKHGSYAYYGEFADAKMFTIIRDSEDPDSITIEYRNGSSSTSTVELVRGGEAVSFKPYMSDSYNSGTASVNVRIYLDEKNNEILEIDMASDNLFIPSYGSATVKLSTKNFGTWENKVYYNNAYLTPNVQSYDSELVSQGNHLLFGNAQRPTVRNSAQITAAYGYVTTSEKRIREIGNETNCASSKDEKNWIFLDEHEDLFRYTNIVNNVTGKPLSKFIMIDNLPEIGDHETFADTEPRYSAFKVELTENPDFEVAMVVEGNKTVLTPDQYEIMFSDRTEFAERDWDDSSDEGWYTSSKKSTRSFRLSIYDDTGLVIPDQASIQVEYNGRIIMADDYKDDEVTTDPVEGTIAWNSFGYHYRVFGENISLEAAPLKVGICIKYIPVIQKSLVYPDGTEYKAAEDENFRFIIYSGSAISGLTEKTDAQIGQLLKNNKRKAILVTLGVKAGQSASEVLELSKIRAVEYDSASGAWKETEEWSFMDGETYTVQELVNADSMYAFKSLGTSSSNSYSFAFNGMKLSEISGVNVRKTWTARINKVDAAESKPLAGAYFGLYTLAEREAMSDEAYNALALKKKPARFINHEGKMWVLSQVRESDASGVALFAGLIESDYIARELQAPGGYKLEKDIYRFSLEDADESLSVEKQAVNKADYELPKTGSKEAAGMMVWGNVLMLIAFAILAIKKNFLREEQN